MTKPFKELRDKMSPEAVAKSKQMAARMTDHDALVRELREAMAQATPGPWHDSGIADPNGPRPTTWIYGPRAAKDHQSGPCVAHSVPLRDAAYIALCSPANMATLLDALTAAQEREDTLRKWLWLNHGCRVILLYGDDGEMQCSNTEAHPGQRFLDFKRHDLPSLMVAAVNGAEAEAARLREQNQCDACMGTGTPISGKPCMCRGTGLMSVAALHLREQVSALQGELAEAQRQIQQAYIEHDITARTVEMLRGVGCEEDGDGPCGVCLKCAKREQDAVQEELRQIATVAHDGGLRGLRESEALFAVRKLTRAYWDGSGDELQREARVRAALGQPAGGDHG